MTQRRKLLRPVAGHGRHTAVTLPVSSQPGAFALTLTGATPTVTSSSVAVLVSPIHRTYHLTFSVPAVTGTLSPNVVLPVHRSLALTWARPAVVVASGGTSYYVTTTGNNANAGTSLGAAWATPAYAAANAPIGSDVYVRAGTYTGAFTMSRAVRLHRYPADARPVLTGTSLSNIVTMSAAGTMLDGFELYGTTSGQYKGTINVTATTTTADSVQVLDCYIHDAGSYGIKVTGHGTTISGCDFYACATGIQFNGGGTNCLIDSNTFRDFTTLVDAGRGANAIALTGPGGGLVTITNNTAYGLRAVSAQFGTDGGFLELFDWNTGADVAYNLVYDAQNFTETGRSSGTTRQCSLVTFRRNVMYGGITARNVAGQNNGLVLRTLTNSLIAHNTFVDLDRFVFDLQDSNGGNGFAGSISGLTIKNNIGSSTTHPMSLDNVLVSTGLAIDYNDLWRTDGSTYAFNAGASPTSQSFAAWKASTGYDAHSLNTAATFTNAAAHDYTLAVGSAGIDAGQIGVLADSYNGSAPDMGRYER